MKAYDKLIKQSDKDVITESSKAVSKGLYSRDNKKVAGARTSNLMFMSIDKEGFLTALTWKQYKALKVPSTTSDYTENNFVQALASKLKNFGTKVDFNAFVRKNPNDFEAKVDWLLKNGAKYTKKGVTV